jgi:hypothetical protein
MHCVLAHATSSVLTWHLRAQALLQEERGDGHGRVAPDALLDEAYRWCVWNAGRSNDSRCAG